jgi:hypothetical protein
MELGEFNLLSSKQQIKYLISLSDIKAEFLWLFLDKGAGHYLLALTLSTSPIIFSSSSELE